MKRVLVALALLTAAVPAARAQTITAGPGTDLSSLVGQSLDVPFVVDMSARAEQLGAFAMRLAWNPAVLRFEGGFPGSFGSVTVNLDSALQGIVRLAGANPSGAGGAVTVAVARFTPLAADTTTVQVVVSEAFAAGTFADLLPAVSVSGGLYCPARGRYGDIDVDGNANSRDALIALSNAVGLSVAPFDISLGDVDADAAVNARDALIILSGAVGLDVSAYRVLALAGGSCAIGPPMAFQVAPGAVGDLVVGQQVQFEARAVDSTGAAQTVTNAQWLVSDPAVLGVLASGLVITRDTGTAEVIAVRDGRDTARLAVHVVARRTTHVVSAAAAAATNRLGTASLPFGDLTELDFVVQPGDTVRLRPGRYPGGAQLTRAVVLIGERSGSATAVIGGAGEPVGLTVGAPGATEIHDLGIEGFHVGLQIMGADTVRIDSLRVDVFGPGNGCYQAGILGSGAWLIEVRRSRVVGGGTSGCAEGISFQGAIARAVIEDVVLTDLGGTGITSGGVDSLHVRRAAVSDVDDYGIEVYAISGGGGSPPAQAAGPRRAPTPTTSAAAVIEDSRIQRARFQALSLYEVRSALVAHTVMDMGTSGDGIEVGGYGPNGSGYLRLVGDSIMVPDNSWIYAYDLDSVVVDSTRVVGAYGGNLYDVRAVRATTSSFRDITYGSAFYIDGYPSGVTLAFDSVSITGSGICDRCIGGVEAYSARGTVNRLWVHNADMGLYVGDSSVAVTNSRFTAMWDAVYINGSSTAPQPVLVRNLTITDAYSGVEVDDAPAVIESLTVQRVQYGIETYGVGADTIRDNTFLDVDQGIQTYEAPPRITGNVMAGVGYRGIYTYGPTLLAAADSGAITGNSVACRPFANAAIAVQHLHARVEGNTITAGCEYGISLENSADVPVGTVRANTVLLDPASVHVGIRVDAGWRARVVNNLVTGGRDEGTIRVGGSGDASRTPWVLVDSNTVQNAVAWGIRAEWLDTLEIRGNLVEDVAWANHAPNLGAIAVAQVRTRARVAGNTVRRSAVPGIAMDQQEYYYYPLDTATVFVDSNAVSATDTVAVRIGTGLLSMRHNNIRNNGRDGVRLDYANGVHVLRDNAFQGNGLYAVNNSADGSVDADSNWWGVNGQPPRQPGDTVIPGVDSVVTVFDNFPLAVEPGNLLPLAPPAMRPVAALPAIRGAAATETPSRSVRTAPPERPAPTRADRRPSAGTAGPAQNARAAVAARARVHEERRAALAVARAERDSVRTARRATQRGEARP